MPADLHLRDARTLTPAEATAVHLLVEAAAVLDGHTSLNEAALLHLSRPREGVRHLLAHVHRDGQGEELVGYAQLEAASAFDSGQIVVAPTARRDGVGTALLGRLAELSRRRLQVWAIGNSVAAQALAARVGLVPARELLLLTRPLADLPPAAPLPAGVAVRSFVPGQDEQAWLRVNARAFASHPEQGAVTTEDLADRMAEAWFDPDGFLLALRGDDLVGFHWTKRHSDQLGEVYVLGVDPDADGRGLGSALLDLGLHRLQQQGLSEVELYVEGDHERAVRLYQGRGFHLASRDVMYAEP